MTAPLQTPDRTALVDNGEMIRYFARWFKHISNSWRGTLLLMLGALASFSNDHFVLVTNLVIAIWYALLTGKLAGDRDGHIVMFRRRFDSKWAKFLVGVSFGMAVALPTWGANWYFGDFVGSMGEPLAFSNLYLLLIPMTSVLLAGTAEDYFLERMIEEFKAEAERLEAERATSRVAGGGES